jgi:hypothetical protein
VKLSSLNDKINAFHFSFEWLEFTSVTDLHEQKGFGPQHIENSMHSECWSGQRHLFGPFPWMANSPHAMKIKVEELLRLLLI